MPDSGLLAFVAALYGLAGGLLVYGVVYGRARAATQRLLATFVVGDEGAAVETEAGAMSPLAQWLARAFRAVRSHPATRFALVVLALAGVMFGFATSSMLWFVFAAAAAGLIFFLSDPGQRVREIERQAPAAIEMMAAGLRAGYNVPQGVALLAREAPEPTASEFSMASREIELGVSLVEALARIARRTENVDYELVSHIVAIQHEVGGNLAVILDSVASTLRERSELRQLVNSLTAQQRLSSIVLTLLPMGVMVFLFIANRAFVEPLFTQAIGRLLLALVGVLLILGWAVMRQIGRVEV